MDGGLHKSMEDCINRWRIANMDGGLQIWMEDCKYG